MDGPCMSIFNIFVLLGGLAMFLYGMEVMGKSLEQTAGGKLQVILSKMTSSPLRGLLLGCSSFLPYFFSLILQTE